MLITSYQNQNDSILLCSKTCSIEIERSQNGWEYQPSNGIASNVAWWERNQRCFECSSVFTTSFRKHRCSDWTRWRWQILLHEVISRNICLHLEHFQAFSIFFFQDYQMQSSIFFIATSPTKSNRIREDCTRHCHWNCVAYNRRSHRSNQWCSISYVSWLFHFFQVEV